MYVAFYYKKIFLTIITNCQSFVLMCGTTSNMCGFIEETVGEFTLHIYWSKMQRTKFSSIIVMNISLKKYLEYRTQFHDNFHGLKLSWYTHIISHMHAALVNSTFFN
jgi:hypothetical protein